MSKKRFNLGIGIPSLLMVFIALCLTVFAVLSYANANSDLKLTLNSNNSIIALYDSKNNANKQISLINEKISELKALANDANTYTSLIDTSISDIILDAGNLCKSCDISVLEYKITSKIKVDEYRNFVYILNINDFSSDTVINITNSYIEVVGGVIEENGVSLID